MSVFATSKGAVMFLTVIIISIVALVMVYGAANLSLGEAETSFISQQSYEAFSVADSCMEEALQRLKINTSYTGATISLGEGNCDIDISGAGTTRTVIVSANYLEYYKKIQANISISSSEISITDWFESES